MSTVEQERETRIKMPWIGLGSAGLPMTVEEFDAIEVEDCDERYRYELIHGVLVVSRIPSVMEGDPNEELGRLLRNYGEDHPEGSALDATLPERYVFTENRRRADRVIWAGLGRMPRPLQDMPTIVVEFVSFGKRNWLRNYVEKRREYLEAGVREYWVIDRFQRIMTVYRGDEEIVVREDQTYRTELLPGFELPLAKLLAMSSRWSEPEEV
jgi:Uma2 family endonuclease